MTSDQRTAAFHAGKLIREEVLGTAHVQGSLMQASPFSQPMQDLVTEYCWGRIWGRPGLTRRDRSLLNLAILTALNRPHELRLHLRGALRNGCSHTEIQEVLLQTAVYCGVPAALESFRAAEAVLASAEEEGAAEAKRDD